jgi:two-component system chemotaxis response regulator CheB
MSSVLIENSNKIRAIVADDTSLYRRTIADILKSLPDVEVVGAAFDGEDCLNLLEELKPDLLTLDIQMPRRDGLSTLEEIKRRKIGCEVVMVCSKTVESAEQTLRALRIGALDLILKPSGSDFADNRRNLESQLQQQVQTVRSRRQSRSARKVAGAKATSAGSSPKQASASVPNWSLGRPKCICIGVSTGGPQALNILIQGLPGNLPVPIFIVQHMPPVFTKSLADHLNKAADIRVSEAVDGEVAVAGKVYIAPGGKHMRVERKGPNFLIQITNDPPIGACKPSVDYLFNSIDECVGKDTLAVILTGMGNDGLAGCKQLHASGAHIIAQNADSCVVYGMPRQIADNNLAHEILPLEEIARRITQLTKK